MQAIILGRRGVNLPQQKSIKSGVRTVMCYKTFLLHLQIDFNMAFFIFRYSGAEDFNQQASNFCGVSEGPHGLNT